MKIIDILCLINCCKEVPYTIRYNDTIFTYDYEIQDYQNDGRYLFEQLFTNVETQRLLNTEVEVLDSKIKKLNNEKIKDEYELGNYNVFDLIDLFSEKINEIIDYQIGNNYESNN